MFDRRTRRRTGRACAALLAAFVLLAAARARAATPEPSWCLPPLFERGERLHAMPAPTAFWLDPALRQHQLCHALLDHPDAPRALLIGSSAVLGFPLPVEETLVERLNQHLAEHDAPGRVFNLGWVNTYQVRDALILRAALAYRPDLIIYPLTLDDFIHVAPVPFPSLIAFFRSNDDAVEALGEAPLPGLTEPLQRYGDWVATGGRGGGLLARVRDIGAFVRAGVRAHAEALARRAGPTPPAPTFPTRGRQSTYDCNEVTGWENLWYQDWRSWNILAYLQEVHDTYGIPVLVVNWPVAHEPVDECYNVRHTVVLNDEYNAWLRSETEARGLGYVDLHNLLTPGQFFDSLHPTAEGHRLIADRLGPAVETIMRDRAAAHHLPPQ